MTGMYSHTLFLTDSGYDLKNYVCTSDVFSARAIGYYCEGPNLAADVEAGKAAHQLAQCLYDRVVLPDGIGIMRIKTLHEPSQKFLLVLIVTDANYRDYRSLFTEVYRNTIGTTVSKLFGYKINAIDVRNYSLSRTNSYLAIGVSLKLP